MNITRSFRLQPLLVLLLLCCLTPTVLANTSNSKPPLIAAASSLQFVLPEIAAVFEQSTGQSVRLVFGSSGNFTRQIQQGAPFEMFMSANEHFVDDLFELKLTQGSGSVYARGRLVLALQTEGAIAKDLSVDELATILTNTRIERFAIANPEHAPYGERAKQVLQYLSVWDAMQKKLVIGENVGQAARFALSPDAQGGIIAQSQATATQLKGKAHYHLIPEKWHEPLNQRMVLMKSSSPVAVKFFNFMHKPLAKDMLETYGFEASEHNTER